MRAIPPIVYGSNLGLVPSDADKLFHPAATGDLSFTFFGRALASALFSDGFEFGSTGFWSSVAP